MILDTSTIIALLTSNPIIWTAALSVFRNVAGWLMKFHNGELPGYDITRLIKTIVAYVMVALVGGVTPIGPETSVGFVAILDFAYSYLKPKAESLDKTSAAKTAPVALN